MIVVRRGRPRGRGRQVSELDDLLRALVSPSGAVAHRSTGAWRPPIDVFEQPDKITIVAEIAGMDREAIEITIEGDIVSLRGNRPDPATCDQRSFHEAHIAYGAFAADVYVPFSIDNDSATATYENGFLTIELPGIQGRTIIATNPGSSPTPPRSDA